MKSDIQGRGVRFLHTAFAENTEQLQELATHCHAAGTAPFCQPWWAPKEEGAEGICSVVYPSFVIPFGVEKVHCCSAQSQPKVQDFLAMQNEGDFKKMIGYSKRPTWKASNQIEWQWFVRITQVKQKKFSPSWSQPGMLSLLLWCGSSKSGSGARARRQQKGQPRS